VLVVDDELAVRELLQDLLAQWGYEVVTADTGKRALELLETRLFDAALLDMWIGDTDGLQLLRAIQQQDSGVALIMMTGSPTLTTAISVSSTNASGGA